VQISSLSRYLPSLLAIAVSVCIGPKVASAQPNLLVNAGAEVGTGTNPGTVSNWVVGGVSNPGRENGTFNSGITPRTGLYSFFGNNGASGTLTQRVAVTSSGVSLGDVDAGRAFASLSFYTQSLNQGSAGDAASVLLTFLNAAGSPIGSPFDTGLNYSVGSWLLVNASSLIPSGTRFVDYSMVFTRRVGGDNDSYFDDNSLAIAVPSPSAAALLGLGGLLAARRRR